jgi:hypothetical protein
MDQRRLPHRSGREVNPVAEPKRKRLWLSRSGQAALEFAEWTAHRDGGPEVSGTIVAVSDPEPHRLSYRIATRPNGTVRLVEIHSTTARDAHDLVLTANGFGHWFIQGVPVPGLTGCLDLGLWASPLPHLLPLARLELAFGGEASLPVAWVAGPDLALTTAHFRYRHILGRQDGHQYRLRDDESGAEEELWVDPDGLLRAAGPFRRLG